MKTISLRLPEPLAARLAALARKRAQTQSAVVRDLLEKSLAGEETVPPGSCLDLAADLIGCVEGPGDLSFNKKHMRGFGR